MAGAELSRSFFHSSAAPAERCRHRSRDPAHLSRRHVSVSAGGSLSRLLHVCAKQTLRSLHLSLHLSQAQPLNHRRTQLSPTCLPSRKSIQLHCCEFVPINTRIVARRRPRRRHRRRRYQFRRRRLRRRSRVVGCLNCRLVRRHAPNWSLKKRLILTELRNRIYEFARESNYDPHYAPPPLLSQTKSPPKLKPRDSGRNFFALSQTSKQLRSEFRPLWLRNSSTRLRFDDFNKFIATFYPTQDQYEIAPKLLVISWDYLYHDEDEDLESVVFDITSLLRFGACSPTSEIVFVSHRLIEFDLPNAECGDCGHSLHCGCFNNGCDHEDAFDTARMVLEDEMYGYLHPLNDIVSNYNESWVEALRDTPTNHNLRVKFAFDRDVQEITVFVYFPHCKAPQYFTKNNMYNGAVKYLGEMGLLDIESNYSVDYVVGRATGKYLRHSQHCGFGVAAYDQVEVPGTTEYKPPTNDVAKASF
jgi:hypothetical protein